MGVYRVAQICMAGHVVTSGADEYPEQKEEFCSTCGEATIMKCPECDTTIRGFYYVDALVISRDYEAPAYCHDCGRPFPWTQRSIDAAIEVVKGDKSLEPEQIAQLEEDLPKLGKDTPEAGPAAQKIAKTITGLTVGAKKFFIETIKKIATGEIMEFFK